MILHTLHHCLLAHLCKTFCINRQSFILTTPMQRCASILPLRYLYMLAKGDVECYKLLVLSPRQTQLTLHNRALNMARGHFISLRVNSAEYDRVWFSAGSAPLTACLVRLHLSCDFLRQFLLLPIICAVFPRSDFFLLSNEWGFKM